MPKLNGKVLIEKCKSCGQVKPIAHNAKVLCKVCNDKRKRQLKKDKPKAKKRKTAADIQPLFNKAIRLRDSKEGRFVCISCGGNFSVDVMEAGHYLSVSHRPDLRFNKDNVHGQCKKCNGMIDGNRAEYKKGLIKKIGLERVNKLHEPYKIDKPKN